MQTRLCGIFLLACSLSACGGAKSSFPPAPTTDQLPGGIYVQSAPVNFNGLGDTLVASNSGSAVGFAIITEAGHAKFVQTTATPGKLTVFAPTSNIVPTITSFTGPFTGFGVNGQTFLQGQSTDTGTVTGAVVSRTVIRANFAGPRPDAQAFGLKYVPTDYEQPASFATIAGTYSFTYTNGSTQNATITVDSSGAITSPADTAGCSYSGQLNVPDAAYNAYDGDLIQTCGSATAVDFDVVGSFLPANSDGTSNPAELYLIGSSVAAGRAMIFAATQ